MLARDRSPRRDLQRLRPGERVQPLAGRRRGARRRSRRSSSRSSRRATAGGRGAAGPSTPGSQALTRLWSRCAGRGPDADRRGAGRGEGPDEPARLAARPGPRTAERLSDCPLSLNAIAKGFIVERACDAALERAAGSAGSCSTSAATSASAARPPGRSGSRRRGATRRRPSRSPRRGPGPGGRHQRELPARVPDRRPMVLAHLRPADRGCPSSGSRARRSSPSGRPTPTPSRRSSTCSPPEEGLRLADALPGVECLIVATDGRVVAERRLAPLRAAAAPAPSPSPARGRDEAGGRRRTRPRAVGRRVRAARQLRDQPPRGDQAGAIAARTWPSGSRTRTGSRSGTWSLWVSLGGPGPFQWLPDLKRWYRGDQARRLVDKTDLVLTIARPTRPPGKY